MKVFVAMSGGVDSSVCLYLLKQQGYDVSGITLRLDDDYDNPIARAKNICDKLCVNHIVLDYRENFKMEVVEEFNRQIQNGITPVPCVICNRLIKLGILAEYCIKQNAKLATGHYAAIRDNKIYRAKDILKDQTHFLCNVKKEVIPYLIFPLGDYLKSEVFRIAKEQHLVNVDLYKESQDVCFFNGKTYNEYIANLNIMEDIGDIIHIKSNKKLGQHHGLLRYTIGQRQGLGIAWSEPLYVVKKDYNANILYVGEEQCLYAKTLTLKNVNFLVDGIDITKPFQCKVCLRDKTPLLDAIIRFEDKTVSAIVNLFQPARAITKGQWCVMYLDDVLIGGGEIC